MRVRKYKDRSTKIRPFEIDIIIPGINSYTGAHPGDRFRCSAETRNAKLLQIRRAMFVDLGQRLLFPILAARADGRFTTEDLHTAYKQGNTALQELLDESENMNLSPLLEEWLKVCSAGTREHYRRQVRSFIEFVGGERKTTVAHLTASNIGSWLNSLKDSRRGNSGCKAVSMSEEASQARQRRRKKQSVKDFRNLSSATRNRYFTAISAFCRYLVHTAKVMTVHPLRGTEIKKTKEPTGRMPKLAAEEWIKYCAALREDPLAPEESVLIARILRHTGADVGEVIGYMRKSDEKWVSGFIYADIDTERRLPQIRFKRHKVKESPERFVPYPKRHIPELLSHIEKYDLKKSDPVFVMIDRVAFENAHDRARQAIGRPDLRLKDFRHIAAISWARAGVRLERMKVWLGHSTIKLTEMYAQFGPDDEFDEPAIDRAANEAEALAA